MTNAHYVIPKLVEDASLKRARTTITEGGEEKEAIRVTPAGGNGNLDSQGVADAMGKQAAEVLSGSVISSLQQGLASDLIRNTTLTSIETNTDVLGTKSDAAITPTQDGSISSRLKMISSYDKTTSDNSSSTVDVLGSRNDTSTSSSYNGSINGRLRYISGEVHESASQLGNIALGTGLTTHTPWDGTSAASLVSIEKRTSNDTHAAADVLGTKSDADVFPNRDGSINGRVRYISNAITTIDSNNYKTAEAAGTQSDPAWSGSGDGTVIALLKGIYNKL